MDGRKPVGSVRKKDKLLRRVFNRHEIGHLIREGDDAIGDDSQLLAIGPSFISSRIEAKASLTLTEPAAVVRRDQNSIVIGMFIEESIDVICRKANHVGIRCVKLRTMLRRSLAASR